MSWWPVLTGCLACYAFKLAGMSVPSRLADNPRARRISVLLPVTLLAALATLQTFTTGQSIVLDARVPAVAVAVLAVVLRAPFIVVVALAAATAALIRAVT